MICLALVSKSRIHSARLYYLILVILPIACVLAIEFEALRFPDGSTICGAGPPIIDGVFRTVSVIGCAIQCGLRNNASSVRCNFFNYFKQSKRCELFVDSPVLNTRPDLDCVSYKNKHLFPRDCVEARRFGSIESGIYPIFVRGSLQKPMMVYCDMVTDGGGWLVFQRRCDGSVNFFRNWTDYATGFGSMSKEFWLGNANLHNLTTAGNTMYTLRVDMQDFSNESRYAEYNGFSVDSASNFYQLHVTFFNGDVDDSLSWHDGCNFTTYDGDYDKATWGNCAKFHFGGWWYNACHSSNLNGLYLHGIHQSYADGIEWYGWHGFNYSLRITEMKFRPQ